AKRATYVGDGQKLLSYRLESIDLQYIEGDWAYHDSYFGGADFIGQEVVYFRQQPVWAMNYYGWLLHPDRISAAEIGQMIKQSLTQMYAEGRFLGGFEHMVGNLTYTDNSEGDVGHFTGKEQIILEGELVYELVYHGGLIKH
ncbi:MAG: hypothetical protein GYB65_02530, partial [Chloroflexi bacterium]|nr:hypothetical protein [Chloroflexota bacterium]